MASRSCKKGSDATTLCAPTPETGPKIRLGMKWVPSHAGPLSIMMKTAKASIENKNKRKRIPLGSFCGWWQPSHTHTHAHTVWGREHLPTYKRNYCHLKRNPVYHAGAPKAPQVSFNMPKDPLLPPNSPCGHSSGPSKKHQNKTHPWGEILSACPAHESPWRLELPTLTEQSDPPSAIICF